MYGRLFGYVAEESEKFPVRMMLVIFDAEQEAFNVFVVS